MRAARAPYVVGVGVLTLLGLIIRLRYLNQPMRYDEAFTYLFFVNVPLGTTLSDYSLPNQHILNSLLMRVAAGLLGWEPWSLRLPAFLFGVAIVPATFFSLRRLVGAPAAFLASSFATVSAPLIIYSSNARGYSLVVLLFLALIGVSTAMRDREVRHGWVWLTALSVIGLYTIPTMLYAIGGIFIWHAAAAWADVHRGGDHSALRRLIRSVLAIGLLTAVLYLPVLIGTGLGPLIANDWVAPRSLPVFMAELPRALWSLWQSWHGAMPVPLVILLALGVVAYAAMPTVRGRSARLVVCIVLWCVALLLITLRPPFARVWLFLLPLYFAVAAAGLVGLLTRFRPDWQRLAVPSIAVGVCVWSGFTVMNSPAVVMTEGPVFPDAEKVVAYLAREAAPGDGVYARTPADAPVWYYTWQHGLSDSMLRLKYHSRQRVLIVVNHASGQTIERILRVTRLGSGEFSAPVLLRAFEHARIYEVRPLAPGQG